MYEKKERREKSKVSVYVGDDVLEHFRAVAEHLNRSLSDVLDHVLQDQMADDIENGVLDDGGQDDDQ